MAPLNLVKLSEMAVCRQPALPLLLLSKLLEYLRSHTWDSSPEGCGLGLRYVQHCTDSTGTSLPDNQLLIIFRNYGRGISLLTHIPFTKSLMYYSSHIKLLSSLFLHSFSLSFFIFCNPYRHIWYRPIKTTEIHPLSF